MKLGYLPINKREGGMLVIFGDREDKVDRLKKRYQTDRQRERERGGGGGI